jgi:hypothetical protein
MTALRARILAIALVLCSSGIRAQNPRGVSIVPVDSGRRMALVIGNNAYPAMGLRNAVNDARAIAQTLSREGFQADLVVDAPLRDLSRRVDLFVGSLRRGDVALVFYSGHGFQINNENFIVPVDFNAQDEAAARAQSYSASRLVDRVTASGARMTIVILDACRTNPFGPAGGTTGLAPMMDTAVGALVAFATSPNRTADDNPRGANGLFTTYVLEAMEAGLGVEEVFSRARQKVFEASQGRQVPWLVSSVIGDFYFKAPANAMASNTPSTPSIVIPPATSPANVRTFAADSSGVVLNFISREKTADFELTMVRLKEALLSSPDPTRRRQAQSWNVYKNTDPGPSGTVVYAYTMDPAVASADYSVGPILVEGLGAEGLPLYRRHYESYASVDPARPVNVPGQNFLHLQLVADFSRSSASAPAPRPAGPIPPAQAPRGFSSGAGIVLNAIKPEKTADFEMSMAKLQQALAASSNPIRRAQASGWKVFRCLDPTAPGAPVFYVFLIDRVVPGADYNVINIFAEAFPQDVLDLSRRYVDAYASGQNWLNLDLIQTLAGPQIHQR